MSLALARRSASWDVVFIWLTQHIFFVLVTLGAQRLAQPYYVQGPTALQTLLTPWTSWDGGAYLNLASHRYRVLGDAAYSPLYPLLIALLTPPFGYVRSALMLSSAAELGTMLLLRNLFEVEGVWIG